MDSTLTMSASPILARCSMSKLAACAMPLQATEPNTRSGMPGGTTTMRLLECNDRKQATSYTVHNLLRYESVYIMTISEEHWMKAPNLRMPSRCSTLSDW